MSRLQVMVAFLATSDESQILLNIARAAVEKVCAANNANRSQGTRNCADLSIECDAFRAEVGSLGIAGLPVDDFDLYQQIMRPLYSLLTPVPDVELNLIDAGKVADEVLHPQQVSGVRVEKKRPAD